VTLKQKIDLIKAILAAVESNLLNATTGALNPFSLEELSLAVEQSIAAITADGVVLPANVQKALAGLVAVLAIV
jgi:hypothetical protein